MLSRSAGRRRRRTAPDNWRGRNIVICNWRDSSHPNAGGAEVYCERVAARFQALGANVFLLTARHQGSPSATDAPFGTIRRMGNSLSVYPLVLWWLLIHRREIDAVVDSQNGIPFFSPLVVRRTTPVALLIHHVHQEQFGLYFPRWLASVGRLLENQVSARVYGTRAVCVVSPSSRAELRKKLSFEGPVYVTPCGQDLPIESPHQRSPQPSVVYVGRIVRQKRLELLIAGFSSLLGGWPDAQLHIVGDGEERERIERLAIEAGLTANVHFHGRVSDRERDDVLSSAWLFVSPSRAEGWGMSVMEAAAHGVPALSFRVAGLQDAILEGETGWLIDEGTALGQAMCEATAFLADPLAAERIGAQCRARVRRFTWNSTADRLLGVLASERERLVHPLFDRREVTDGATIVAIPRAEFSIELLQRLRRHDQARFGTNSVELLLVGADEDGAMGALQRIGFPLEHVQSIRVARASDLLGWDLDAASAWLGALTNPEVERDDDPFATLRGPHRRFGGLRVGRISLQ